MMAHDSSAPRRQLSPEAIARLEAALEKYLQAGADPGDLQAAIRSLSTEARANSIHAEQILVLLKDLWFGLPQIRSAQPGDTQPELLQRAVTLCIREYYAS
jgi:hypothetical protein